MTRQSRLFDLPKVKRVVRAHVVDAGNGCDGMIVSFECKKCAWRSDWVRVQTVSEGRKGVPCPVCNGGERGA